MYRPFQKLDASLDGYIATDDDSLRLYATDASLYQIKPEAIAFPKNTEDCQKIVAFAAKNSISIIPRGAGTSLAGQAIGAGIIVDVSRFMDHIIEINPATATAVVQPGVIPTSINSAAAEFNLFFPPNPSTDNRCNIGGMIGNNAWGTNAPQYGDTSDYITEIEMVLADSSIARFADVTQQQLDSIFSEKTLEANVYRDVIEQVKQQRQQILSYPWYTQGIPNNMAYRLHKLLNRVTDPQSLGPPFNMSQLLCGSEGTLGLITEVTLSLRKQPAHRNLLCAHFPSLYDALNAVPLILSQCTVTIELLDKHLIDLIYNNPRLASDSFWVNHDAQAILLIEVVGNDAEQLKEMNDTIRTSIENNFENLSFHELLDEETLHAWHIRKSALGMLFGMPDAMKAISFVEDTAVSVQHLAEFTHRVNDVLSMLNIRCIYYGSVSRGLLHIRPLLDLSLPLHKEYLKEIQAQIFSLVDQYGGSISAKHGDGRIRAESIKSLLGENYINACQTIKNSFDPDNIFNPGTIFSDHIDLENFRPIPFTASSSSPSTTADKIDDDFAEKAKILLPSVQCHGAAVCLQTTAEVNVCPTYKAVRDEALSTRGRANLIRQSFTSFGKNDEPKIDHKTIDRALHHCLACQACKSDCPAHVDMASIKMHWLNATQKSHARSLNDIVLQKFPTVCSVLSKFPRFSNSVARLPLVKSLLKSGQQRSFPTFSSKRLSKLVIKPVKKKNNQLTENSVTKPSVIIINDVFSEYFDQDVGSSTMSVLSKMGYTVRLTPLVTSLRVFLSSGNFDQARLQLKELVSWLDENATPDDILIGLEPSEVLALHNECVDISRGTSWYSNFVNFKSRVTLLDEFIVENKQNFLSNLSRNTFKKRNIYLHTHCHQKSNHAEQCSIEALELLPNCSVKHIKTGCCGMAGNFGYQKENYDLSVKVAQLDLLPAIAEAKSEDIIVATGTSCRAQINDLSDRTAIHSSQVFSNYMNNLIE